MSTTSQTNSVADATTAGDGTFSAEERKAMKERAAELKAEARRSSAQEKIVAEEAAVLEKIAGMPESDRVMAERLHAIVAEAAPELTAKLYYGQPGWAKAGKVVVFFRSGLQDKDRYSTLGFSSTAALDDEGGLWPTAFALDHLTDESAKSIAQMVTKAAG